MVQRAGRRRRGRTADPRLGRAARRATCVAAAIILGALSSGVLSADTPPAGADPAHAWGGLAFRAGSVCSSGGSTAPLASWDLGNGLPPGYLVSPVAASGGVDSAVPPLASLGAQSTVPISSNGGSVGQLGPEQVPGLAALLSRHGFTRDDATAAALAHLVMTDVAGSSAGVPSCDDQVVEARLQQEAATLAGPYALSFAAHPAPSLPGRSDSATVTVTGATGSPVPGAAVTFGSSVAVFGGSTSATATTDASGRATARFTVPAGTPSAGVDLTATTTVATSLTGVTIQATPTATNPSGAGVAALVPGAPSTAQASSSVRIDRSAHPKLSLTADPAAALQGATITPVLDVSGLNGHAATATVTTVGPLPLADRTLCSTRTAGDFAAASAVGPSDTVQIAGDGVAHALSFTASRAGCYLATARLTTTDATPQVSTSATTTRPITVLDTAVSARLTTPLVGRNGSSSVEVQVQRTHSVPTTIRTVVTGPVVPRQSATGCGSVDYGGAPSTTADASAPTRAPPSAGAPTAQPPRGTATSTVTVRSPGLGCSRVQTSLVMHAGGGDLVVAVPTTGTSDLLTIAPRVQLSTGRSWGQTGARVTVQASVSNTANQPGHVSVHLLRTSSTEFGCRDADFAHPSTTAAGAAAAVTTDYSSVPVTSRVVTGTGCYLPVAVLHMDANADVSATSRVDTGAVIAVGLDPSTGSKVTSSSHTPDGASRRPILIAVLAFAALVLAAIVATLRLARDSDRDGG